MKPQTLPLYLMLTLILFSCSTMLPPSERNTRDINNIISNLKDGKYEESLAIAENAEDTNWDYVLGTNNQNVKRYYTSKQNIIDTILEQKNIIETIYNECNVSVNDPDTILKAKECLKANKETNWELVLEEKKSNLYVDVYSIKSGVNPHWSNSGRSTVLPLNSLVADTINKKIYILEEEEKLKTEQDRKTYMESKEYKIEETTKEICWSMGIINESKKYLDKEKKIGQTSGVVDKRLLYEATKTINTYEENIKYYKNEYKKLAGKSFSPSLCKKNNKEEKQTERCKAIEDAINLCRYYSSMLTAQGVVNNEKTIGRQAGVINTQALHHAGEAIVEYKHYLNRGGKAYQETTGSVFNPSKCSKSDVEEGIQNNLLIQKKKELCGD